MISSTVSDVYTVKAAGASTTSGNSEQFSAAGGPNTQVVVYVNITAQSGTTPTLTLKLQDSPDGVNWYTVPTASAGLTDSTGAAVANNQIAAATGLYSIRLAPGASTGDYLRLQYTIAGTTPSYTFSATAYTARA